MKVLFTTDGEAPSEVSERLLVQLGDRATLDVTAFSVTTYNIDPADDPHGNVESARATTEGWASSLAGRLKDEGFRASSAVAEGDPGAEIVRKVESEGFDITVVGAGRHTWLRERLLGTVGSYVLQNSPTSVLLVKESPEVQDKMKVLIATDGSDDAQVAITSFSRFVDPARCSASVVSIAQSSADAANENVDKARTVLDAEGITSDGAVHEGSPSSRLLELMEEGGYGLVVLGSRGQGPIRRALLGSVSDQIAHHAPASFIARALEV